VPIRFEYRDVRQGYAGLNTPQHEPTAAHISPADEFSGKDEPLAKHMKQWFHVFRSCNAAQKNNLAIQACDFGKQARVTIERYPVPRVGRIQVA
jgi:hypothetical protein